MRAYIVVAAESGRSRDVAQQIAGLPGVKMADACWGSCDVFAVVDVFFGLSANGQLREENTRHDAQNNLLGEHRSGSRAVDFCRIHLPIGQSAGGPRIRACGISATTAHYSWDRQTPWRDHPRPPRLCQTQGVGLCRIHIRVDLGICCALSGKRWLGSIHAADIAAAPCHLLCDPPGKSAVAGDSPEPVVVMQPQSTRVE